MKKEILAAYLRVSTPDQVSRSIPEQKLDAEIKAKSLGMELELYSDEGLSASKDDNIKYRPEIQRLLHDISAGKVKHLYTEDSTRLSREDAASAIIFGRIKKYGVKLYYKNGQVLDLRNPIDKLQVHVLDGFAQYEGSIRQMRFEMGLKQATRQGRFVGPSPPFGYKKNESGHLIIDEDEKIVFLEIVKQFLDGQGTYRIAQRLNVKGVETRSIKRGKFVKWNAGTIASMLKNPVYYGVRFYGKENNKVVESTVVIDCPPIIDQKTFMLIQKQFVKNRIHSKRNNSVNNYLLRGLIKCGKCNENYHGKIKPTRGERLYCCLSKRVGYESCSNKNINLDRLDNAVWCMIRHTPHFYNALFKELNSNYDENSINREILSMENALQRLESEYKRLLSKLLSMDDNVAESSLSIINKLIEEKEKEMKLAETDLSKLRARLSSRSVNPLSIIDKKYIKNGVIHIDDSEDKMRLIKSVVKQIIVDFDEQTKKHTLNVEFQGLDPVRIKLSSKPYRYREGFEKIDDPFRFSNENGLLFKLDLAGNVNSFKEKFDGLASD